MLKKERLNNQFHLSLNRMCWIGEASLPSYFSNSTSRFPRKKDLTGRTFGKKEKTSPAAAASRLKADLCRYIII